MRIAEYFENFVDKIFYFFPCQGDCEDCSAEAKIKVIEPAPHGGLTIEYLEVNRCPVCGALTDVRAGDTDVIYPARIRIWDLYQEIAGVIWGF